LTFQSHTIVITIFAFSIHGFSEHRILMFCSTILLLTYALHYALTYLKAPWKLILSAFSIFNV